MNPVDRLKSVLCAPDGQISIRGSEEDRAIIKDALDQLEDITRCMDFGTTKEGKGYK